METVAVATCLGLPPSLTVSVSFLEMTAVLSMSDVLRRDRHMSMNEYVPCLTARRGANPNRMKSFPPNTDWREKYNEVGGIAHTNFFVSILNACQ